MNFKDFLKNAAGRKSIMISVAVLGAYTIFCGAFNQILLFAGLFIIFIYLIAVYFILKRDSKTEGLLSESNLISSISFDFVMNLTSPVVIINDKHNISWYNKAFTNASGTRSSFYGKSISEVVSDTLTAARIEQMMLGVTVSLNFNGVDYDISSYRLNSSGKSYCLTVWYDKTELLNAKAELSARNVVVAFVIIDNMSEAMQFIQDKYHVVSAQVAEILNEWCKSLNGIIKEYERDKYVILFEEQYLKSIIDSKFDILDRIRMLTIEDVNIDITASIGVAKTSGTLREKERVARHALESALERGGDQAVLRTDTSVEYYGGKTKTVQKRTKIRSRMIAGELLSLMKSSENILIMGHKFADHDSIASCIAVARLAQQSGKQIHVIVNIHDFNLKSIFAKMKGNKYYTKLFTDAVSAQDLIRSDTLVIICDVNNPSHFEAPEVYRNCAKFVIIDHHRKASEFENPPALTYIEPAASSTSEMMCEILEQSLEPGSLPQLEAELLFAGLLLDTNQFTKNTGVRTFGSALYLRSEGADPIEARKFFSTNMEDFLREIKFESNIVIYRDIIAIAAHGGESLMADKIAASKAADRLLSVEGVDASFVVCSVGDSVYISARSNGTINVQLILEKFGGGGHYDSAGAQINNVSINDALIMLKQAIDNFLA